MANLKAFLIALAFSLGVSGPAAAKSIALLIANSNYTKMGALRNPQNDIQRIGASLQGLGFEVRRAVDLPRAEMTTTLINFAREARGADTAMVFYSGHGFEAEGINYLIPVDFAPRHPSEVKFAAIRLDDVMDSVAGATRLSVVVLDACRDNPLASSTRGGSRGLARVTANPSQVVAYSTAPGMVAQDGYGTTSPYTQALAEMLERSPNIDVRQLFTSLSARTTELAQTTQTPYAEFGAFSATHVSLTGAGLGRPTPPSTPRPVLTQNPNAEMLALWDAIKDSGNASALDDFAGRYPTSPLAGEAQRRSAALQQRPPSQPRYAVEPNAKHAAAPPANKSSLLPHASQVPPTSPLAIDGIWTADFNGGQFRIDRGRIFALTAYSHLIVFPVEAEDVTVQGLRATSAGRYAGFDLPGQAPWTGILQPDGTIQVSVASLVPFQTVLRPVQLDNRGLYSQAMARMKSPAAVPAPSIAVAPAPTLNAVPQASALPFEGQFTFEMSCEALRDAAAVVFGDSGGGFVKTYRVSVANGGFVVQDGTPGQAAFTRMDGTLSGSGDLVVRGTFLNSNRVQQRIRFDSGRTLRASGKRGKRYCEVVMRKE